jgi:hypothetical protein
MPSMAATVTAVEGQVSINRGNGFQQVTGAAQAEVGDLVMVGPNGTAQIVYSDDCSVPVLPGKVMTITAEAPCKEFAADLPAVIRKAPVQEQPVGVASLVRQ